MISVTLPPDLETWAAEEVANGHVADIDALVTVALAQKRRQLEGLRAEIEEGRRSAPLDGDVVLAELDAWVVEDQFAAG